MTVDHEEMRHALIAAVQAELQRHAKSVNADLQRVVRAGEDARQVMQAETSATIEALREELASVRAENDQLRGALDQRVDQLERRVEDSSELMDAKVSGLVEASSRPLFQSVRDEQDELGRRVEHLDKNLRKFDEQAARMVSYFNELAEALESRSKQARGELREEIDQRIAEIDGRVDDAWDSTKQFQQDTSRVVVQRIGDLEDRMVERILATEGRIASDVGDRIAQIDAHVGRISAGLDDTLGVVTERLAGLDARQGDVDDRFAAIRAALAEVDVEAIEELKEKLSTAAGEAVLIRIDLEKLEKVVAERFDTLGVRITDVESQVADQTMDVNTAVQLDRLEELERAVIELGGPGTRPLGEVEQFDDLGMPVAPTATGSPSGDVRSSPATPPLPAASGPGSIDVPVPPPPPSGDPTTSIPPPPAPAPADATHAAGVD